MRLRTSAGSMAFTTWACSLGTTSRGTPAGTIIPNQANAENPGSAASAIVGTSGRARARASVVTASTLSRPVRTCGSTTGPMSIAICTSPPTTAAAEGALPR